MSDHPKLADAKMLLAEATQRKVEEIPLDASVETWGPWDSLTHMRVIMGIETKIGHELPPEAVVGVATLNDIAKYLAGDH